MDCLTYVADELLGELEDQSPDQDEIKVNVWSDYGRTFYVATAATGLYSLGGCAFHPFLVDGPVPNTTVSTFETGYADGEVIGSTWDACRLDVRQVLTFPSHGGSSNIQGGLYRNVALLTTTTELSSFTEEIAQFFEKPADRYRPITAFLKNEMFSSTAVLWDKVHRIQPQGRTYDDYVMVTGTFGGGGGTLADGYGTIAANTGSVSSVRTLPGPTGFVQQRTSFAFEETIDLTGLRFANEVRKSLDTSPVDTAVVMPRIVVFWLTPYQNGDNVNVLGLPTADCVVRMSYRD